MLVHYLSRKTMSPSVLLLSPPFPFLTKIFHIFSLPPSHFSLPPLSFSSGHVNISMSSGKGGVTECSCSRRCRRQTHLHLRTPQSVRSGTVCMQLQQLFFSSFLLPHLRADINTFLRPPSSFLALLFIVSHPAERQGILISRRTTMENTVQFNNTEKEEDWRRCGRRGTFG